MKSEVFKDAWIEAFLASRRPQITETYQAGKRWYHLTSYGRDYFGSVCEASWGDGRFCIWFSGMKPVVLRDEISGDTTRIEMAIRDYHEKNGIRGFKEVINHALTFKL